MKIWKVRRKSRGNEFKMIYGMYIGVHWAFLVDYKYKIFAQVFFF